MMFDERLFNAAIARLGETQMDAAKIMGINPATLFRKMKGKSEFRRNEIERFCAHYQQNPNDIFFAKESA